MYRVKMFRSPQGAEMSGSGSDPSGSGQTNSQENKQTNPDQTGKQSEADQNTDPGKENFFLNLLKESKGTEPEKKDPEKSSKKETSNYSKDQLIDLKESDPETYMKMVSQLAIQDTLSVFQKQMEEMQSKFAISTILSKAEAEGVNKNDFAAFSEYYGAPINDKTLELYKMVTGKKKKSEFDTIKKTEELQKGKQPEPKQEKPKNDESDPIARRIKMAERV